MFCSRLISLILGLALLILLNKQPPVIKADICPGGCVNNTAANNCGFGYVESSDPRWTCNASQTCCVPIAICPGQCTPPSGNCVSNFGANWTAFSPGHNYCRTQANNNTVLCCLPPEGGETSYFCDKIENPLLVPKCALAELGRLTAFILEMATFVAVIMSVVFILIGGFQYITSQDNTERLERARGRILWAVVGLLISASVFILVRYLSSGLQIPIFGSFANRVYAQESVVANIQISGKATDSVSLQQLKGVDVTIYVKDGVGWQVWPGKDYNNQRNPQKVSEFGEYTYLVPEGEYYVRASLFGYHSFKSEPVMATDRPIRIDVSLEPAPTFWNIVVGIGVVVLVVLVLYVGIKAVVVWQKKRAIKALVLKSVRERELTGKTDVSADTNNL